jgi:putative transcriptional regulator
MSVAPEKDFLEKLGRNIKARRELLGITQTELAKRCDRDRQNINRIEKGNINISIGYLKLIANNLDITLSELLNDLE